MTGKPSETNWEKLEGWELVKFLVAGVDRHWRGYALTGEPLRGNVPKVVQNSTALHRLAQKALADPVLAVPGVADRVQERSSPELAPATGTEVA